jgi:hypothetical protein
MVKEFKYLLKRIWYYYILKEANWVVFTFDCYNIGDIVKTTYNIEAEIISHANKKGRYFEYLIKPL